MEQGEWVSEGRRVLVRARDGVPRLWIDGEGDLQDEIGIVRIYGFELCPAWVLEPEELAVFVAEWIACAAARDGAIALGNVHPELRACVYELTPSALVLSDEDCDDVLLG